MQVSVYLSEDLIERIDELAGRLDRSRSRTIQELLEMGLRQQDRSPTDVTALAGRWKDDRPAEALVREVMESRAYNRRSERPAG